MTKEKKQRIVEFIILTILYGTWISLSLYWFNWKLALIIFIALTAYGYDIKIRNKYK